MDHQAAPTLPSPGSQLDTVQVASAPTECVKAMKEAETYEQYVAWVLATEVERRPS